MDFNSAIQSKMQDIKDGSTEPFLLYRDSSGDWHCDYTQNQFGETFDWVEDAKAQDPLAMFYTGKDLSNGSFPSVYDSMLYDRIKAEYYIARSSGRDSDEIHAMTCFFQDNVGEFSHNFTDYLTTLEKPLAALIEMSPFSLATENKEWMYNEELAHESIEFMENEVNDRLHNWADKVILTEKHCIADTHYADFTGKLLVVKADALMPEYRDAESQIVRCTHGNGAHPNAKGRSIFCKELASDKTVVYYRAEIEGIADYKTLPAWAKRKLAEQTAEKQAQKTKSPEKTPSLLDEINDAKAEAEARNAALKNKSQEKKRDNVEI